VASTLGNQQIATRYATALFGLAQEQGQTDRVAQDLETLATIINESADFGRLLSNAALKRQDVTGALLAVAENAKLSDLAKKFLGTVAQNGRAAALPAIVAEAQAQIARARGEITAEVTSAQTLDKAQADAVAAALKKALGQTVKVKLLEDAALIGGLVVRVGSRLIDGSVRSKLERLARALKSQDASTGKTKMKEVA
jgi:F-type H+-transporting ATPase subunit delta